ncbi:MAG: AAA family ATPase [Verrucomicrobiaceae bacterium]
MKTLAFFNNKGGVGKTTLVYHLAWMFSRMGKRVVVADLDPQANLTSMFLPEETLEEIWSETGPSLSIMRALAPIIKGTGDITTTPIQQVRSSLWLIPGDLGLAQFEGELSEAWGKCLDGKEPAFRTTSAFYRIIQATGRAAKADIMLIDVGPNLGAINRAALICADAIVLPLAPDLFSLQGLRNLGPTLKRWRNEWKVRLEHNPADDLKLPSGELKALGYVILQFGLRDAGTIVKAYERWARKIPCTYAEYILGKKGLQQTNDDIDGHRIAMLKHYRSLVPMAMEARKPIFDLKAADGALGAHTYAVQSAYADFRNLAATILERLELSDAWM